MDRRVIDYFVICSQDNPKYHMLSQVGDVLRSSMFNPMHIKAFFGSETHASVNETIVGAGAEKQANEQQDKKITMIFRD
jgi:hypothetical protein